DPSSAGSTSAAYARSTHTAGVPRVSILLLLDQPPRPRNPSAAGCSAARFRSFFCWINLRGLTTLRRPRGGDGFRSFFCWINLRGSPLARRHLAGGRVSILLLLDQPPRLRPHRVVPVRRNGGFDPSSAGSTSAASVRRLAMVLQIPFRSFFCWINL